MSRAARVCAVRGLAAGLLSLLAACNDGGPRPERAGTERGGTEQARTDLPAPPRAVRSPADAPGEPPARQDAQLAYSHELVLGLPPERVGAQFAAVRDRCLDGGVPGCVLLQSSIHDGRDGAGAQLQVRLPRGTVRDYLAFASAPAPGGAAGEVRVLEQTTRADDLTRAVADVERRLAQLTAYRERLAALAQTPDSRVDDLLKVAGELARVQTQIEEAEGRRRGFGERLDTEAVWIRFRANAGAASALAPVQEAWARSGVELGRSAAAALSFTVASLPWIPVAVLGILLTNLVWRLRRRRRARPARLRRDAVS